MAVVGFPLRTEQDRGRAPTQLGDLIGGTGEARAGGERIPIGLPAGAAQCEVDGAAAKMLAEPAVADTGRSRFVVEEGPVEIWGVSRVRLRSDIDDGAHPMFFDRDEELGERSVAVPDGVQRVLNHQLLGGDG